MKKLIVNTGTLSAGGAERVLSILSKPFADTFEEVQYVIWLDEKYPEVFYEIDSRVKIIKMSKESGRTRLWKQMIWFRNYIKREKPDLVLSFMVMICFTVTISLLFAGIDQVVAERNDPRFLKRPWFRRVIDLSYFTSDVKGIVMQTQWNKSFFKNSGLYNKTTVICNPIDIDRNLVGAALKTNKDNLVVSVGRLTSQKKQEDLIAAFSIFSKTHPDYKLVIYGEGELRGQLEKQIKELGLSCKVELPGRSNRVIKDLMSAKMFVSTSLYEGMSNALIEAMCIGLPCISTKVSGAMDLINDGDNGILVEQGDFESIVNRMEEVADNESLQRSMGEKASLLYLRLNADKIGDQWVKYLLSCI